MSDRVVDSPSPESRPSRAPRTRAGRLAVVLLGALLGQLVLFGPSLVGSKALFPLDLVPLTYPAPKPPGQQTTPDFELVDRVTNVAPNLAFLSRELAHGRMPRWNPHVLAGAPFVNFGMYSVYNLLLCLFDAPDGWAWAQLLRALFVSLGTYLFFRRSLSLRFWPSCLAAWSYPITGYLIFWEGYASADVLSFFPWLLVTADSTVRNPRGWSGLALAALTALAVFGGQLDFSALVLVATGLYALWRVIERHRTERVAPYRALTILSIAFAIGLLLSAPYSLPLVEFARHGKRLAERGNGFLERPPGDWSASVLTVFPYWKGPMPGSAYHLDPGAMIESAAAGYAGMIALLVLAPLAWCHRRRRRDCWLWSGLLVLALAWSVNLPGIVWLMERSGLNLLSYSRLVFLAGFAITVLAALGWEAILEGEARWRRAFLAPMAVLALLAVIALNRSLNLPSDFSEKRHMLENGQGTIAVPSLPALDFIEREFARYHGWESGWAVVGLAAWVLLARRKKAERWPLVAVAGALLGELLWQASGFHYQGSPDLYFPENRLLRQLAESSERVMGVSCLPSNIGTFVGWHDVRGYDAIDYGPYLDVLDMVRDPGNQSLPYARLQYYRPRLRVGDDGQIIVPPLLNMLNLRYLIFCNPHTDLKTAMVDNYLSVVENPKALPRAFLPRRIVSINDESEVLPKLEAADFDPAEVAYLEGPVMGRQGNGTASVQESDPETLTVSANLSAPAVVVLADLWYPGWVARERDRVLPIWRANHILRAIALPAGAHSVTLTYEPGPWRSGTLPAWLGLGGLAAWAWAWAIRRGKHSR